MANAIVHLAAETSLTLTLSLFPLGSDTAAASAKTLTEQTNRKGVYLATVTEALTGWHVAIALEGTRPAAIGYVFMSDTTATHYVLENARADVVAWAGTAVASPHTAGYPVVTIKDGNGTGEINTNNGTIVTVGQVSSIDTGGINSASFAAGAITASSIAADAITDAKVASDVTIASVTGAVGSVTGAVGSVTARVTANTDQLAGQTVTAAAGVTFPTSVASPTNITAGTVTTATNVTTVNGLAAGVITAAAIATSAIDADSIAADAGVEIAAAVWDRVLSGATHNIASSAGRRLRQLDASSILSGTATAGATNSITLDGSASATNDIYDENLIVITGGTGAGQTRVIVEYNGSTLVAIVNRVWQTTPDATSTYDIIASAQADIAQHGLAQAGSASTITLSSAASTTDDIYIGSQVYLSTSTGTGQTRLITDYVGATKVATVSPDWVTNPTSSSVYKIIPIGRAIVDSGTVTTATNVTTVNGLAAGVITAASIASDAITDAKVASDVTIASVTGAVGSVTGAVGSVTGNVGGNVTGSVGSVTAAITLPTIPTDWITAAGIAADAIGSSELAASAVTEIQSGMATAAALDTVDNFLDTEIADIQARLPAALVSGRIDASVGAMAANTLTASALATDAVTEIQSGVATAAALATAQTSIDDLPTNAELTTALAAADDAVLAAIAALNNLSSAGAASAVTTALTTALTEGYRGTGATGSVRDLLYEIIGHLGESSIVTTTKTVKKIDGSTTAKVFTLNSATTPTSITETT